MWECRHEEYGMRAEKIRCNMADRGGQQLLVTTNTKKVRNKTRKQRKGKKEREQELKG
jgi:hypothetical protein